MKITVLGSGGWGTALALLLLENGHEVTLWSYTEEESRVLRETREQPHAGGGAAARDNGPGPPIWGGEGLRRRGDGHPVLCGPRHCRQAEGSWPTRGPS